MVISCWGGKRKICVGLVQDCFLAFAVSNSLDVVEALFTRQHMK